MKKIILLIFLLLFKTTLNAQKHELGSVSIAELQEKFHPSDSSAVAAILYNKGRTYFDYREDDGFKIITEVEVKIKIYKKEGYEWANNEVPFYIGGIEKESVIYSKAVTYNLVNGQVEKTRLKSENEFSDQKNKFWSSRKIVMPNVKEGSIVEFKYTIKSPYYSTFPDWKFQKIIPVNFSEYITEIPEYFTYNPYRKGTLMPKESLEKLRSSITFVQKDMNVSTRLNSGKRELNVINYTTNRTKYSIENLVALKEESYVNNIENYAVSLQHELSGVQMPQSPYENYSTSWEDVAKKIYENDDFGKQIDKNKYYEKEVNLLLKGITSDEDKVGLIFNYVKNLMNWNSLYGYLTDVGVNKAYFDKTGNVSEINLMLVSMLRFSGIKSNPVLISTRSNGISFFPTRTGFNYVIANALVNDKIILLDATSKNSFPNLLPIRDLNWIGREIEKDGTSQTVNIMPEFNSSNTINIMASINSNGEVSGKLRQQYNDYYALQFRDKLGGVSNDDIVDKIQNLYNGLEVSDYELTSHNLINEPIIEKYSIKNLNTVEVIGNKIFFSPMLHLANNNNPFKQETREYPIDFSFPINDRYRINITIPDGYIVENLPKPAKVNMENNYGSFNYTISNTNNQIQLLFEFNINSSIVPANDYEIIKEFYKLFIEKNNEKVILKKA